MTLVELVVCLAVLGVVATVAGLSARSPRPIPKSDAVRAPVMAARDSAIRSGHPVTCAVRIGSDDAVLVTAFPDGTVVAGAIGIDLLTGEPIRAPR